MRLTRRRPGVLGIVLRTIGWALAAVGLLLLTLFAIDSVGRPVSTLMLARLVTGRSYQRDWVPLSAIAPVATAMVIASEDAQFCRNGGVDWGSLKEVLDEADGPSRGASTITMQTAKNLFLWPGRSSLRKGIEIAMALALGKVWSKAHTLEVYLNIAEWGDGIFGIETAARVYFGKSARRLDAAEAALLATALPNPIERDPADPSLLQRRLAAILLARARGTEAPSCLRQRSRPGH